MNMSDACNMYTAKSRPHMCRKSIGPCCTPGPGPLGFRGLVFSVYRV